MYVSVILPRPSYLVSYYRANEVSSLATEFRLPGNCHPVSRLHAYSWCMAYNLCYHVYQSNESTHPDMNFIIMTKMFVFLLFINSAWVKTSHNTSLIDRWGRKPQYSYCHSRVDRQHDRRGLRHARQCQRPPAHCNTETQRAV